MENKFDSSAPEIGMGSFTRHATPARNASESDPVSAQYPDITEGGVEQAKEVARGDLLEMINRAPAGTVMFIGGKTDQARTGQSAEIYGDELAKLATERDDLVVITKNEIDRRREELPKDGQAPAKERKIINLIQQDIENNPDKKIVVDYPLYIKEFGYAYNNRWTENGKKTPYFEQTLKKHGGSHAKGVHDWFENEGVLKLDDGSTLEGPHPEEVATDYLRGLARLYDFAKNRLGDRPVIIHGVGHQWDLDAVAAYLAKGKADYQSFKEVMGREEQDVETHPIGESELVSDISLDTRSGKATVHYRDKDYTINLNELNKE